MGLDTHFLMGLDTHSMVVVIVATLLCLWMNDCRSVGWQYQWSMDLPYANRFYPDGNGCCNSRLSDRISELMVHIKSSALVLRLLVVVVVVDRFVEAALCDCLVPSALFS